MPSREQRIPLSLEPDSVAVFCPSWIGDTVMATPVFRAIRRVLPDAWLLGVMRPGLDEVLAGTPWFNEMLVDDGRHLWGGAKRVRRFEPQAGLLLPNSFRSALTLRLSGVRVRIGYNRDGRGFLLTHAIAPPPKRVPIPAVKYYAALACAALGVDEIDTRIELATTDAERAAADELLRDVPGRFALLNPGANRADKRWPAERFAAVADVLHERHKLAVVINVSPRETDIADAICASSKIARPVTLANRGVTLGSLKAVIDRAALMITNDTGPRHIAAALGTPLVTLFGPTDHRWTTLDGVAEHLLLAEPFLPEELTADAHANACAIERIAVGDVVVAAERMIRK